MQKKTAILYAVLAAFCYGVSTPASKALLGKIPPAMLAALLYLGAGLGMGLLGLIRKACGAGGREARLTRGELPWVAGMIALDIAAPVLLMFGLTLTTPANVSLLNNFEIVATAMVARLLFREPINGRMWIAIALITLSTMLLTVEDRGSLTFSAGSLMVLLACLCWGLENNITRRLSAKDPLEIVTVKGIGSGTGAMALAAATGALRFDLLYIGFALLVGFSAYGMSIWFYVRAQRYLGAARTSAYYAVAPFVGAALSLMVFRQPLNATFLVALGIMVVGACIATWEKHAHLHRHEMLTHDHRHTHDDGHHTHTHGMPVGEHSHPHTHEAITHTHPHTADLHHLHRHG